MALVFAQTKVEMSAGASNHGVPLPSPATGQIEWLPAKPFSLGFETFAIKIENNRVYSPITAGVAEVIPSYGAITLITKSKLKFVLSFDPQYANYFGEGIKPLVKTGQTVKKKQAILELDLFKMKNNLSPLKLFVKVFNLNQYKQILMPYQYVEANQDAFLSLIINSKK